MPTTQTPLHSPAFVVQQQPVSSTAPGHNVNWFTWTFWGVLICLAGGAAWAYSTGRVGTDHRAVLPPENPESLVRPDGIMVTADKVTTRSVKRTIEAVGTLYGFEEIIVSAKTEGRILRIHHDVSDRVSPGEVLIEVDPTDSRLALEQAKSNLQVELAKLGLTQPADGTFDLSHVPTVVLAREKRELARLKMDRIQNLAVREATTKEGVDNAVSEFRMASAELENQLLMAKSGLAMIEARQAALAISEQALADTSIRTPTPQHPCPGNQGGPPYIITKRSIAEGSFVRVGDELCRLVIDGTLKLRVAVPERHNAEVRVGQAVEVLTASTDKPCHGMVTVTHPSVDTATRTFTAEIQVANDRSSLRPGSFAKAVIEVGQDAEARTVPLAAMVRYAGVIKLFLIEDGKAREVQFTPGIQTAEWVEVAAPAIQADRLVVTSGQFNLATGTNVVIREPSKFQAVETGASTTMPETTAK